MNILLVVLLPTIVIVVLSFLICGYKRTKNGKASLEDGKHWNFLQLAPNSPVKFTFKSPQVATNKFDMHNKLGEGGYEYVFKGNLVDGTKVVIKHLDHLKQGRNELPAEVQTIGSTHHFNLDKLDEFCAEKLNRLLVYVYMSNESLDKWIFGGNLKDSLAWNTKKKIILNIAKILAYLHEECQKKIAHLDVKPQYVLLDDDFHVKLYDFGLAKLIDRDQSFEMTQMRGTRGCLASECLGRKITKKADVYSYGILVSEVVFGRKNLDSSHPDESIPLIYLVKMRNEESRLLQLFDNCSQNMLKNFRDIEKIVKLVIWCLHTEPTWWPSMSTVVKVLEGQMVLANVDDYSIVESQMNPTINFR